MEKIVRSVMEGYKLITTAPEGEIEARFKRLSKRVKRVMFALILKDFHDLLKVRLHFSKNAHAVQYIHRASFAVLGMKGTSKTLELEILVAVQAYHRYRGPALARKIVSNMKICDGARLGLAGVLPASFIPPASSAFPSATLPCTSYSSRMSRAAVV